jgi:hypothetical protein
MFVLMPNTYLYKSMNAVVLFAKRTKVRTDLTKLTVAFRNIENRPNLYKLFQVVIYISVIFIKLS